MLRALILLAFTASSLLAQVVPGRVPVVITSAHLGAISVPAGDEWKIDYTNVYDDGTRPVLQLSNEKNGITASIILFDNYYHKATATGCRKDATDGILQNQASAISDRKDSEGASKDGTPLALTNWIVHGNPATTRQRNLFAFASDAELCYEIHVSKVLQDKPVDAELEQAMQQFPPLLGYKPEANDYFIMASLLYAKTPMLAAPYYKDALDRTPADTQHLTMHRVLTDQLVISLARSGDLKASRAIAEHAIEADPDHPLNYYNLACADAEAGDAKQARIHLEQAFARRQNVLAGERMPEPAKDESFSKLKTDEQFWAFVQTLH